ncbi:MAG: hypothetical protein ACU843_09350 [Gammaproteobacteria bacterium]
MCIGTPAYSAGETDRPNFSARVADLIGKAKAALQENRLTVPSGNNAVGYAQQVLDLAPGHPEAQRILRAVVARYETLGNASVDRADALWTAEIEKAQTLQQRGTRVAQAYHIPSDSLAKIDARIADARRLRADNPVAEQVTAPGDTTQVAEIIERYLNLSEQASSHGTPDKAESHLNVSKDLMTHYPLTDLDRDRLSRHLVHTERRLAASQVSRASLRTKEPIRHRDPGGHFFMPPSF